MALTKEAIEALMYYNGNDEVDPPKEAVYRGLMAAGYFTPSGEFTEKGKAEAEKYHKSK